MRYIPTYLPISTPPLMYTSISKVILGNIAGPQGDGKPEGGGSGEWVILKSVIFTSLDHDNSRQVMSI